MMRRRLTGAGVCVTAASARATPAAVLPTRCASRHVLSLTSTVRQAQRPSAFGPPPMAASMQTSAHSNNSRSRGGGTGRRAQSWKGFQPQREREQRARENAWHQFRLSVHVLRQAVIKAAGRTHPNLTSSAITEGVGRGASSQTDRDDGIAAERETDASSSVDWMDPATQIADAALLDALGVTDLRTALGRDDSAAAEEEAAEHIASLQVQHPTAPTLAEKTARSGDVPSWTDAQAQQLRPLVARACRAGLHARVAPVVVVQRVLEALLPTGTGSGGSGTGMDVAGAKEHIVEACLPLLGATHAADRQAAVLGIFDDASLAALLSAEAEHVRMQVAWSQQRLRDSRSPAAERELKGPATGTASLAASAGEPVALQYQLLAEHRHAEQLLVLFAPRICQGGVAQERDGTRVATLPRLVTLEAGLRLCAAMQGGQGAARAVEWAHAALTRIEKALVRLVRVEEDGDHAAPDPAAVWELVRETVVECCALALQATTTDDGRVTTFESNYALMMRCMAAVQRASDAAAAGREEDEEEERTEGQGRGAGAAPRGSVSLQDTLTHFADITLRLYAPLAEGLPMLGHAQHLETMRSLLVTLLRETDIGYAAESVPLVQRCFVALLEGIAALPMDGATRAAALEDLWRTVMLNSRSEVWQAEAVNAQVLRVLFATSAADAEEQLAQEAPPAVAAEEKQGAERQSGVEKDRFGLRQERDQQRALNVFNTLMEPSSRVRAFREDALGRMTLAASLRRVDDDLRRFLSYAVQRYPLSMDTAHGLVAKLLLQDELRACEHHGQVGGTAAEAAPALSSPSVYLVLDTAVSVQRKQHDAQAARTFFLRLLTLYRDVRARQLEESSSPHDEAVAAARDGHCEATLRRWLHELAAARVCVVSATIVELMAAIARCMEATEHAAVHPCLLPQSAQLLKKEAEQFAEALVTLSSCSISASTALWRAGLVRASDDEGRSPTHAQRAVLLTFPEHFAASHCADSSSPWTVADIHAFLADLSRLVDETDGDTLVRLRDYATLGKLHRLCERHGLPPVLQRRPSAALHVLSPCLRWREEEGEQQTTALEVETALGTTIPQPMAAAGSPLLWTCTTPERGDDMRYWLSRLQRDGSAAEGDGLLGGGDVGLSSQPLFSSLLSRVWLPAYHGERRRMASRQAVSAAAVTPTRARSPPTLVEEIFASVPSA